MRLPQGFKQFKGIYHGEIFFTWKKGINTEKGEKALDRGVRLKLQKLHKGFDGPIVQAKPKPKRVLRVPE